MGPFLSLDLSIYGPDFVPGNKCEAQISSFSYFSLCVLKCRNKLERKALKQTSWGKLGLNLRVISPQCQPLDSPPKQPHN